jgi:hypothetical protein
MPLPGGPADKFGNRYEGRWTVYCMLRILHEEARAIYLEPVGDEGQGIEFRFTRNDNAHEYHQVKRQHGGGGAWTIVRLGSDGVLATFREKLSSSDARCVFVSMTSADQLRELAERAARARTLNEFLHEFIAGEEARSRFASLRQQWGHCQEIEAYEWLRRLSVETATEDFLLRELAFRAATLVDGQPENTVDILAQFALDSVHRELDAHAIWEHLRTRRLMRRHWNNDPYVLGLISEANARYLSPIRRQAILGKHIPRDEAKAVIAALRGDAKKRAVLVTGDAGSGKTGVIAEAMEMANQQGWLVLGMRLDRLEPVQTTRQLGAQMDFPASPVYVLGGAAGGRACLLVIDQLDAVSMTSGRHPHFFDRVGEMIDEYHACANMRLLLSCRKFDLDHDSRLRNLTGSRGIAEVVAIGRLSQEVVHSTLEACGVAPASLSPAQMEQLTVPLHLKLLTEIVLQKDEGMAEALAFTTLEDLYKEYWLRKRDAVGDRGVDAVRWTEIIDDVLARMVKAQALSVLIAGLEDTFGKHLNALISEGVLVQDGNRLSFFHETFFDYAFARRFSSRGQRLAVFLREQGQHLFLRATVRQILNFARACQDESYLSDLRELLSARDIRFHLKHLVIAWLRALPDPAEREWNIVQQCMLQADAELAQHVWTATWSRGWFILLDSVGYIQAELHSGDSEREIRIVHYLVRMVRELPDRVAGISLSFADRQDPWPQHAWKILERADINAARPLVDLYRRLVEVGVAPPDRNPLTHTSSEPWFPSFYELPETQPEWALDAFETWLIHFIRHNEVRGELNPFRDPRLSSFDGALPTIARSIPARFTEYIFPIVLELVRRNARRDGQPPPWRDQIWGTPLYKFELLDLEDELIESLVIALEHLALEQPAIFAKYAEMLQQYLDFITAGFMLARAYTANGQQFADQAASFLRSDPAWLALGWSGSHHWVSGRLLAAITPHCSEVAYRALEELVLSYYPDFERDVPEYQGHAQLALLPSFVEARRSPALQRRLGELQRKFSRESHEPPQEIFLEPVGPPFDASWEKLEDEHWLRAIKKYAIRDGSGWPRRGGAWQLSDRLQAQVKQDPVRFARLLHRFPDDAHAYYFDAVLRGLAEASKIDTESIWEVIRHCHRVPKRPCGRAIDDIVSAYVSENVPSDILEIVGWYATESPDPEREVWQEAPNGGKRYYGGDPEEAGLNSVRGGMAWAVAKLLFEHPGCLAQLAPYIEQMVNDPSIAVRTQVAHVLLPILNIDRDRAVNLFLRLCDVDDDILLAGNFVRQFVYHACYTHLDRILPILDRMLASPYDKVRERGANLVSIAALIDATAESRADKCLDGPEPMRKAAAEVAAANLVGAANRIRCRSILLRLFEDSSNEVRKAAATCFSRMSGGAIAEFLDLVRGFIASKAFHENTFYLFRALETTTAHLPEIVCTAVERILEALRVPRSTHVSVYVPHRMETILLRAYEGTDSPDIKERCLDLLDAMLMLGVMHSDASLEERR